MAIAVKFSHFPRSVLPSGGLPADDRAYLAWRTRFVDAVNTSFLDRRTRFGHELPDREPIDPGRFDEFLFINTGGDRVFDVWNHSHRQRHLGIVLRDRRRIVLRLARRYAAMRIEAVSPRSEAK